MPSALPDCHLVRTAIPILSPKEQPRCFPLQSVRFFSLFCRQGFREQRTVALRPGANTVWPLIRHTHARQATSAHSVTAPQGTDAPHCRFIICFVHSSKNTTMGVRLCTRTGLHRNRVGLTMPLEIALSPQARVARFPPAPTQHWAYQAGTTGFIDVPFRGFLGPP